MRPAEALAARHTEPGARALLALVGELAARVDPARADERAAEIVLKLYGDGAIAARLFAGGPGADARVVGYLRRMLRNAAIDAHRRDLRHVGLDAAPEPAEPEAEPEPDPNALLASAWGALDAAIAVVTARRQVDPDAFRATVRELVELAMGRVTTEALAAGSDAPAALRARLLRRHARAREHLRDAIPLLAPETGAQIAALLDAVLLRRRPSVSDPGGDPRPGGGDTP